MPEPIRVTQPQPGDDVVTSLGDAEEGFDVRGCISDLVARTHLEAQRTIPHDDRPCAWLAFAAEPGADGGRAELAATPERFAVDPGEIAALLAEWDAAGRPFAVVHWVPAQVALRLDVILSREFAQRAKDRLN